MNSATLIKRCRPICLLLLCIWTVAEPGTRGSAAMEKLFAQVRKDPSALRAFFLKMPKGADLHHHLTGSTYAEYMLEEARSGFCVDPKSLKVSAKPCLGGSIPLEELDNDQALYDRLINAWSTRDYLWGNRTGHDQFFGTFGDFSATIRDYKPLIVELRRRAAQENLLYLETMLQVAAANHGLRKTAVRLDLREGFESNYAKLRAMPEFEVALGEIAKALDSMRASDEELGCERSSEGRQALGCEVQVRYQYHALRVMDLPLVFTDAVLAYEAAARFPEIVGVNMVGPEDYYLARRDYRVHMELLRFLNGKHPGTRVALHAGELVLGLVPPDDLRFHIREAIEVAGAQRIGHGSDISYELGSEEILARMSRKIPVELAFSSNDIILGLKGDDHPIRLYMSYGVPICLASDDAGVGRTDLNEQYLMAAVRYPELRFEDFKSFARNGLEYGFLEGESIWAENGPIWRLRSELRGESWEKPSARAKAFLAANPRAALSWELELRLAAFERMVLESRRR